ncbi:MAG: Uma2 family endonuclease [Bacteroidetes bacterium]|nr:Uma2 family endonuclease [Bacteroidota bacterium]
MPVTDALHPPRTIRRPKVWTIEDLDQFGERLTPRLEIIDGVLYADGLPVWEENPTFDISPAPNPIYHQQAVLNLAFLLKGWLSAHAVGEVFVAPVDIHLPGGQTVEPDVFVMTPQDMELYHQADEPPGIIKAVPLFVAEVLSPRTATYDRHGKRELYENVGVREYLIVDARAKTVEQYVLTEEGVFADPEEADETQRVLSAVLTADGEPFGFDVARLFEA